MILIHHNPKCGTSRNVLAAIRASGTEPVVNEYLQTGWTRPQLLEILAATGLTARDILRTKAPEAKELEEADHEALIDAMIAHPILVERPIVVAPKGVALCRPADKIVALLENPLPADFVKEDGKPLVAAA